MGIVYSAVPYLARGLPLFSRPGMVFCLVERLDEYPAKPGNWWGSHSGMVFVAPQAAKL